MIRKSISITALSLFLAAALAFPASATGLIAQPGVDISADSTTGLIIQPGVTISEKYAEELGIEQDASADAEGEASESDSASVSSGSSNDETAAATSAPGVIAAPGVELPEQFVQEGAESGETGESSTEESPETDPAALSLLSPNTVIGTGDPSIVYINGRSLDLSRPVIALTYDDGPRTDVGEQIMDVMAAYGQKCTFFLMGIKVAGRESELLRIIAEGHEIGNHSYSHEYFNKISPDRMIYQVDACNQAIAGVTGEAPAVMRLPGGNKNETVLATVNMPIILWNIDTRDWETKSTQSTIDAVIGKVKSGDIVLMHETYLQTAAATAYIVPTLVEQGYQMLTISELAAVRGVTLQPGQVYYSF